jgi:hypothetical protein
VTKDNSPCNLEGVAATESHDDISKNLSITRVDWRPHTHITQSQRQGLSINRCTESKTDIVWKWATSQNV